MLAATMTTSPAGTTAHFAPDDGDHALVRSASRGDVGAFESLYRRHVGRVHGVIARLVGYHGARAEDLTLAAKGQIHLGELEPVADRRDRLHPPAGELGLGIGEQDAMTLMLSATHPPA